MMKQRVFGCLLAALVLIAPTLARAQSVLWAAQPPFSGTAIGNGQAFANSYFIAPAASLQFSLPFSYSYWIQTSGFTPGAIKYLFANSPATSNTTGFASVNQGANTVDSLFLENWILPASKTPHTCNASGRTCARSALVTDGNWHNVCASWSSTGTGIFYIDGAQVDSNPFVFSGTAFTNTTSYWTFMNSGITARDVGLWNVQLTPLQCQLIYQRGQAGFSLATPALNTGLIGHWPLNNCTGSGCPDSINGNTAVPDTTPPTMVISTPSAGTVSGQVSMTGTCSDAISCTSVQWIDCGTSTCATNPGAGVSLGTSTTSPYTTSWDSTKMVDGTHVLLMLGTNVAGVTGTATVTLTLSNGVSAKTFYADGTAGVDSGTCQSSGSPCLTLGYLQTQINAAPLHGGDSILLKEGTSFSPTAELLFVGTGGNQGAQNLYSGGQGYGITFGTYGGGTCNVAPGGTVSGCATITVNASSTQVTGMLVNNVSNFTIQNLLFTGGTSAILTPACTDGLGTLGSIFTGAGIALYNNTGNSSGVTITNNKILDFTCSIFARVGGGTMSGIQITNNYLGGSSTSVTVDNGFFGTFPGLNGGLIQGNYFVNLNSHPLITSYFAGCCGFGALVTDGANDWTIQYNVVNSFNKFSQTTGSNCGSGTGFMDFAGSGFVMQFNEVYNGQVDTACDGDGYDLDAGANNSAMQYNYSHNNIGNSFLLFNAANGSTLNENNIIRYNIGESDTGAGYGVSFAQANTGDFIYNNLSYSNSTSFSSSVANCFAFGSGANDAVFVNNICFHTSANPRQFINNFGNAGTISGMTLDYNLYWTGSTATNILYNATTYNTLAAFRAATGFETHGIAANPNLASTPPFGTCYSGSGIPAGPQPCPTGYELTTGSPAIGVGLDLTQSPYNQTITQDYYGNSVPNGVGTGWNIGPDGAHH